MDERMKHRAIGFIVIIAVMLIVAPVVIKSTEPVWHTLHRRGEFSMPKEKPRESVAEIKHAKEKWQAPKPVTTVNLDKARDLTLNLQPVKRLPIKTRLESLPTVSAVRLAKKPIKPVITHSVAKTVKPVVTIKPLQLKKSPVMKPVKPLTLKSKVIKPVVKKSVSHQVMAKPRLIRVISAKNSRAVTESIAKASRPQQAKSYRVQVAMMSSKQNADNLKARLHDLKLNAVIKTVTLKNKRTLYLVKLADSFSQQDAISAKETINKQLHVKSLVRRG